LKGALKLNIIPITKNNYPKGEEIPAQGRDGNLGDQDGKLGGRDGNIFEVMFLRFAAHHVIPGLTHHLLSRA